MKVNLLNFLNENSKYVELINKLESNNNCSCFGLSFNEISFIISSMRKQTILVVNTISDVAKYETQLKSLGKKVFTLTEKVENFTFSFFNEESNNNLIEALFKLKMGEIDVLILLNTVLMQKVLSPKIFEEKIISFEKGKEINFNNLTKMLTEINYKRVEEINFKGEFTLKGDILTIFPTNSKNPLRISFFDNEIERISTFNLDTYEVLEDLKLFNLCLNTLYFYDDNILNKIIKETNKELEDSNKDNAEKLQVLKGSLENLPNKLNSGFLIPFLNNFNASILDYLTNGMVVYLEPKLVLDAINTEYVNTISSINNLIYEGALLNSHKNVYLNKTDVFKTENTNLAFLNLNTSNKIFESKYVSSFLSNFTKNYNQNFTFLKDDIKNYLNKNYKIILCCETNDKAIKMQEFLKENEIFASLITNLNQVKQDSVYVLVSKISSGAIFVEDKVALFGNFNVYGNKKIEIENSKLKKVFFTPSIGDYVVHETFGICKCKSIEKVTFNSVSKDYIVLEFFGGDILYLPSEKANLITKFIGDTQNPKLNKLGTNEFLKEKNKVKQKVKEMAFDLLNLYAKRESTKGFKFCEDDALMLEFENSFPFELTEDQAKAISDIKKDMESEKVMDRLVCGDVGYGKTEVALRAIFKAVLSGKQVAFLAPTTILSEQHYKTCLARLNNFMVRVEVLNRFKNTKEVKRILTELKEGKIDVICGTHRLLSKDVEFKDLGLLVLDEEQRFGVEDKEKIKNLKNNIDVLTLSATPIPRTLHISLIGVRDISIIDTPPKNRIPVKTIVTEYSSALIKDAITKELNRGGQVLIVYNRVESINQFANNIKTMFPNISLAVAHGQMPQKQLEDIINKVYLEEVKILISTVLIENGIDLPKANTIIVTNSDKLGLSQLYQLRGRVGRSDISAYAYFTYASHLALTEEGYKRLSALSEFSSLGSGFKIAMRDLEIRGAGEILGSQQSGHIEKVGYDMYTKLLKEAVQELKGESVLEAKDCKMEVSLSSFISKEYIESEEQRIRVYEQISKLKTIDEKQKLEKFLNEKFGEIPNEISNLMLIALLKNLLVEINAKRFVLNSTKTFIEFYDKNDLLNEKVSKIAVKNKRELSIKLSPLPIIEININKNILDILNFVINILINA